MKLFGLFKNLFNLFKDLFKKKQTAYVPIEKLAEKRSQAMQEIRRSFQSRKTLRHRRREQIAKVSRTYNLKRDCY